MAKPDYTVSPLVAQGLALRADADLLKARRDAVAAELAECDRALRAVQDQLIILGAGRYGDAVQHHCTVVASIEAKLQPDTFKLKSAEDELLARQIAGDDFRKLFDRHEYWTPKPDFRGLVTGRCTPKPARELIDLCLIPGQLAGGRAAYVRWK